jgi:hypothetical protein
MDRWLGRRCFLVGYAVYTGCLAMLATLAGYAEKPGWLCWQCWIDMLDKLAR